MFYIQMYFADGVWHWRAVIDGGAEGDRTLCEGMEVATTRDELEAKIDAVVNAFRGEFQVHDCSETSNLVPVAEYQAEGDHPHP